MLFTRICNWKRNRNQPTTRLARLTLFALRYNENENNDFGLISQHLHQCPNSLLFIPRLKVTKNRLRDGTRADSKGSNSFFSFKFQPGPQLNEHANDMIFCNACYSLRRSKRPQLHSRTFTFRNKTQRQLLKKTRRFCCVSLCGWSFRFGSHGRSMSRLARRFIDSASRQDARVTAVRPAAECFLSPG